MAPDEGGGIAADEGNSLFLSNYSATDGEIFAGVDGDGGGVGGARGGGARGGGARGGAARGGGARGRGARGRGARGHGARDGQNERKLRKEK